VLAASVSISFFSVIVITIFVIVIFLCVFFSVHYYVSVVCCITVQIKFHIQGGPKSKPLPNDQKIVLNRIKACQ